MGRHWRFLLVSILLILPFISLSSHTVKNLPGFGDLPFQLETGYVGVGENDEVQLFYYFVESQRCPFEDPVLLLFAGGPGCSGLSPFFYLNGPLMFDYTNFNGSSPKLLLNPHTWTKVLNIIYIDAPVGTGFSYSRSKQGYYISDKQWVEHSYTFLRKWFVGHPQFQSNPLYIGGCSYSGVITPLLVEKVYEGNKEGVRPYKNIKGYLLSSPKTDWFVDINFRVQFAHQVALVSDELHESIKESCKGNYVNIDPNNKKCVKDFEAFSQLIHGLNALQILEPICVDGPSKNRRVLEDSETILQSFPEGSASWCRGTKGHFTRCNRSLAYTIDIFSVVEIHKYLSNTNLRALVYCADQDLQIPHISTQSWIKSLNLTISDTWHAIFVDDQVAGYTETYQEKDYYMTYGTGHAPEEYKPKEAYEIIDRWLSYKPI
ncbi:hypothetical protein L6164_026345 [Bauhinia variegata]|uniref:Uncharacterized protein n=1 Tax=Bauhinia variegata TaxID=167791 RepID=A0ACB9LQ15_BAUVA|nr:hypothetical protein L6164_026345 [Bauhinia variegata]